MHQALLLGLGGPACPLGRDLLGPHPVWSWPCPSAPVSVTPQGNTAHRLWFRVGWASVIFRSFLNLKDLILIYFKVNYVSLV